MPADVSLVSGTYNRLSLLQQMVESARASAGDLNLQIIIVDGGSTDGTQEWAASHEIDFIEQGKLLGAIKAYNAGCEIATGKYLVIGNDDVTFDGDTIARAYDYMEANPDVGQAAFQHRYQRRGEAAKAGQIQRAYGGYVYGQCSMIRTWLGNLADWWGKDGMRTYGGDSRLSLRLWEMGWPVVPVAGCSVTDHEHQDELREMNSDTPWKKARADGKPHPDLIAFGLKWDGRLPKREDWIPSPAQRVLRKAEAGNLRTLRFKGMMRAQDKPRTALIDALAAFGKSAQVNQNAEQLAYPDHYQQRVVEIVNDFAPDLLILQAQRDGPQAIEIRTINRIRQMFPWLFIINWDGDTHYPLEDWHFEIASAVNLQLTVSPTLFQEYAMHGVAVGYWPIGIEREYLQQERAEVIDGPDVLFTGALYGIGRFPEAEFRRDAVVALSKSGLEFDLYGYGWDKVGLSIRQTVEAHAANAEMMSRAKMTLSISQSKDLWGYTSDRLYNITATGCPALVQRFAGMDQHGYIDGQTCIAFSTIQEMLEKARYYTEHDMEREAIGKAGRIMTHGRHTWQHRLEGLWCMLEGLP